MQSHHHRVLFSTTQTLPPVGTSFLPNAYWETLSCLCPCPCDSVVLHLLKLHEVFSDIHSPLRLLSLMGFYKKGGVATLKLALRMM